MFTAPLHKARSTIYVCTMAQHRHRTYVGSRGPREIVWLPAISEGPDASPAAGLRAGGPPTVHDPAARGPRDWSSDEEGGDRMREMGGGAQREGLVGVDGDVLPSRVTH